MSYRDGNSIEKTNFSANGQQVALNVAGLNSVQFEFSGTYAFTATFEKSTNSTNGVDGVWFPVMATQVNAATNSLSHSTANATQAYEASCHNDNWIRVRLTAYTSAGVHRVAIVGSEAEIEPVPAVVFPASQVIATPAGTALTVNSAATTNGANHKSTAGNLFEISISNVSATPRYVKLYNKATAPTVGTDVPLFNIVVPANSSQAMNFGQVGKRFAAGIGMAITANQATADATAIGAGEVQVNATYI